MLKIEQPPARCTHCGRVYEDPMRHEFDKIRCGDCGKVFDL